MEGTEAALAEAAVFSSATPAGLEVDLGLLGVMDDDVACVKAFVAVGERVRPDA